MRLPATAAARLCCCTSSAARSIPGMASRRGLPSIFASCATTSAAQGSRKKCGTNSLTTCWSRISRRSPPRSRYRRLITSSPSRQQRRKRCALPKNIQTASVHSFCAIRLQVSIPAAPRHWTSAPPLPRARACAPHCRLRSYPPQLGEREAYEAYLGRYLANDPVCFGFAFRALARTNMLHMLPKVRCPAMVVAGRHDTVRPHAGSAELAKKIPGARFELIDEGGHFLPTQAPGVLLALLQDFLPR